MKGGTQKELTKLVKRARVANDGRDTEGTDKRVKPIRFTNEVTLRWNCWPESAQSPYPHATCYVTVFSRPRSMTAVLTARNQLDPRALTAVSQYRCALYCSAVSLMRRYGMWGGQGVPFAFYSRHRSLIEYTRSA